MALHPTREITILYFAAALSATRTVSETIALPSSESEEGFRLSDLDGLLTSRYPGTNLADVLRTSQWSVNAEMVDDPEAVFLKGGEEVAVICPVSGG